MSRDLKEIFDLEQLRRAWGDPSAQPAAESSAKSVVSPVAVPVEDRPLGILAKLEEAIMQEFSSETQPLFRPTLEDIRALLGIAEAQDLGAQRHEELSKHFIELEDLLDSLSLSAASQ